MFSAARFSLLLAVAVVTLAAVAAVAVYCGWYETVAKRVRSGSSGAASATGPAAPAPPVHGANVPHESGEASPAIFQAFISPEERFERLVDGVIDLAIEEVGEQMRGEESADAETRRQCDQRRAEVGKKRRAMYVVYSQEKEGS